MLEIFHNKKKKSITEIFLMSCISCRSCPVSLLFLFAAYLWDLWLQYLKWPRWMGVGGGGVCRSDILPVWSAPLTIHPLPGNVKFEPSDLKSPEHGSNSRRSVKLFSLHLHACLHLCLAFPASPSPGALGSNSAVQSRCSGQHINRLFRDSCLFSFLFPALLLSTPCVSNAHVSSLPRPAVTAAKMNPALTLCI